jgi:hypothetical protein
MSHREVQAAAVRLIPSLSVRDAARIAASQGCELRAAWDGRQCHVEMVRVDDVPAFLRRVPADEVRP